ncbi:MAG: bifunctional hydroxymethylpyrimidine kinase/phosphomethylpyrimidine kinase [Kiritimatiellae bacterium]|nr:bifunctional hydroxymethylpyrimidine kinase/phosphomethylpyrimidine kinase [Kiritimatiellia bacterium]
MHTALTIAGSDSSGGAGIQADIKAMTMNGVFAMSAITALTAQNTLGVTGIMEVAPEFLALQLDAVFTDIRPDAVKVGMVASSPLIRTIAAKLKEYGAERVVVDPVMVATSGARLISEDAIGALCQELMPLATVITPNIPEAEVLSGMAIHSADDMETAAGAIGERLGCAVLCKGGHSVSDADDVLWRDGEVRWFRGRRIDNPNTHGTGCTLSSAMAANLAKGVSLDEAVARAKEYLSGALAAMLDLGHGRGPMNHAWMLEKKVDAIAGV